MADIKQLETEAADRLAEAKKQKNEFDLDLREGYFFTAPARCRDVSSETTSRSRPKDAAELQISLGIEVAQDFTTELLNAFTPENSNWAEQKSGIDIKEEDREEIDEAISEQTEIIMGAIKASNFYSALAQTYMPDIALGTCGMFIDAPTSYSPFICQAVPIRELEINTGPDGEVDDRFIIRHSTFRHLPALLRDVDLPEEIKKKIKHQPKKKCVVKWGWWRLWDKTDDVYWQSVVLVDKTLVHHAELKGDGSCPFIVWRFNPDPMFAFGNGPTLQTLPELRRLDETEALKVENADFQIHPAFVYADDGVMNFATGIEPGMGYKARPWGQGAPVQKLSFDGNVNFAEFETQRVESRVRRLHFVDQPEQIGRTPPTAEQWADERNRAKRRIGTPGKTFFREGPAKIFTRFKWLLEKLGKVDPVQINGQTISLVPYDPTEQAQEYQEVQTAIQILQVNQQNFGQTGEVQVDGPQTMKNIQKKLKDKIVVFRDDQGMANTVEQLGGILGGGGAAGGMMPPGMEGMPL